MSGETSEYIPRRFRDLLNGHSTPLLEDDLAKSDIVLILGQSGAGKSKLLKCLAEIASTPLYTASQVANGVLDKTDEGAIVFIDALDELFAPGRSLVHSANGLFGKLKASGVSRFLLSCRDTLFDARELEKSASAFFPKRSVKMLKLEPLDTEQARQLLTQKLSTEQAEKLASKLANAQLAYLLKNPLTLDLLADIYNEVLPTSKTELFELAVKKLIKETNQIHRQRITSDAVSLLATSQELAAALVFSGGQDFTRDELDEIGLSSASDAKHLLATRLMIIDAKRHQFFHRSILEFLAAKHCVACIERKTVTARQVRTLFESQYGGVPSFLAGTYAWICTLLPQVERPGFLRIDPLVVLFQADLVHLSDSEKYALMQAIGDSSASSPWFDSRHMQLGNRQLDFWTLAHWAPFLEQLKSPGVLALWQEWTSTDNRIQSNETQAMLAIYGIATLGHSKALEDSLLRIAKSNSLNDYLSRAALEVLIQWKNKTATALENLLLTDDVHDAIKGDLLIGLYPQCISPDQAIDALKTVRSAMFATSMERFWEEEIFKKSTPDDLAKLAKKALDESSFFSERTENYLWWQFRSHVTAEYFERCAWTGNMAFSVQVLALLEASYGGSNSDRKRAYQVALSIQAAAKKTPKILVQLLTQYWHSKRAGRPEISGAIAARVLRHQLADFELSPDQRQSFVELAERAHDSDATSETARYWLTWIGDSALGELGEVAAFLDWTDSTFRDCAPLKNLFERQYCQQPIDPNMQKLFQMSSQSQGAKDTKAFNVRSEIIRELPRFVHGEGSLNALYNIAITYLREDRDDETWDHEKAVLRVEELVLNGDELGTPASRARAKACIQGLISQLSRPELPTAEQVIEAGKQGRKYLYVWIGLAAMQAHFSAHQSLPDDLSNTCAERLFVYWLDDAGAQADWIHPFMQRFPELGLRLIDQTTDASRKHPGMFHRRIRAVRDYASVRKKSLPLVMKLLKSFPARATTEHHEELCGLAQIAQEDAKGADVEVLDVLIGKKLDQTSLLVELRARWLSFGLALSPQNHMSALKSFLTVKKEDVSTERVEKLSSQWPRDSWQQSRVTAWPVEALEAFIGIIGPHVPARASHSFYWLGGFIDILQSKGTLEAKAAFDRLLSANKLSHLFSTLELSAGRLKALLRDTENSRRTPTAIVQLLGKGRPGNVPDLKAWLTDLLRDRAERDRNSAGSGFHRFWNKSGKDLTTPREENDCRDQLLDLLKPEARGIANLEPKGNYKESSRADIKALLAGSNTSNLSIEIKKSTHKELWTAIRTQLIVKYSVEPGAQGHGIYLVLWFGVVIDVATPPRGVAKPRSARALEKALRHQLTPEEQRLIEVIVMDCSPS